MCLKTYPYIVINGRVLCDPNPNLTVSKAYVRMGGDYFPWRQSGEKK